MLLVGPESDGIRPSGRGIVRFVMAWMQLLQVPRLGFRSGMNARFQLGAIVKRLAVDDSNSVIRNWRRIEGPCPLGDTMPRIFGFAIPFIGAGRSGDASKRRTRVQRPNLESLEGRTLLSHLTITFDNLSDGTYLANQYVDQGLLFTRGIVHKATTNPTFPPHSGPNVAFSDLSSITITSTDPGHPWSSVSGYVTSYANVTLTLYDPFGHRIGSVIKTGNNLGGVGTPNALLTFSAPEIGRATFSSPYPTGFSLDDVGIDKPDTPKISITSFEKDSPFAALTSSGDYNLVYQVTEADLPNDPRLTVAVYWASGLTAESIIPGIEPVATGRLEQTIGIHTFPVHIAQLVNPPLTATNLIAVLDNNHLLSASDKANAVIPLGTAGVPSGITNFNAPLSFELQALAPQAQLRELRVWQWLRQNADFITRTAKDYDLDPLAIAGPIAWEALQNVRSFSVQGSGLGKIHVFRKDFWNPSDAERVEGTNRYGHYLSRRTYTNLRSNLNNDPRLAITYIAAIMNAYAYEAEHAPNGQHIRNQPAILASYYVGEGRISPTNPSDKRVIYLYNSQAAFKERFTNPRPLMPGSTMGQWVEHNSDFLRSALAIP